MSQESELDQVRAVAENRLEIIESLQAERDRLQDKISELKQRYQNLSNASYYREEEKGRRIHDLEYKVSELERTNNDQYYDLEEKDRRIRDLEREKSDLQNRLYQAQHSSGRSDSYWY